MHAELTGEITRVEQKSSYLVDEARREQNKKMADTHDLIQNY